MVVAALMDQLVNTSSAGHITMDYNRTFEVVDGTSSLMPPLHEQEEEQYIFDNLYVRIVLFVLYTIVFVFCFFGNLAVVLVMALHWKMRNITKFCLGNLAFANLCVGMFCVYQNLTMYIINRWIFGDFLCKVYHFTNSLSHTASILILIVISVERYLAILHPFKCRSFLTIQRLRLIILAVWIVSALICSPRLYYISTIRHPYAAKTIGTDTYEVICVPVTSLYDSVTADIIQFVIMFLFPLLVISILYAKIGFYLRERDVTGDRSASAVSCSESDNAVMTEVMNVSEIRTTPTISRHQSYSSYSFRENNNARLVVQPNLNACRKGSLKLEGTAPKPAPKIGAHSTLIRVNFARRCAVRRNPCSDIMTYNPTVTSTPRPHKAVIRMLTIVVVTFAICNLPFHLRKLYQNFGNDPGFESELTELIAPATFLMMYANCAINPLLYGFMSKGFRSSFRDILRCKLRKPSRFTDRASP